MARHPVHLLGALLIAATFSLTVGHGREARAAALEVAPVLTDLVPGQQSAVLTITNTSPDPTAVQVRSFAWSQNATSDQLDPTEALMVSPTVFQLQPGAAQVVRILLRRPPSKPEETYRLLVDEIPPPGSNGNVRFALRLSLPVFAHSAGAPPASPPEMRVADGRELVVVNRGPRRLRLVDLELLQSNGERVPVTPPENPYVLPGVERHWQLRGVTLRPGMTARANWTGESGRANASVPVTSGP